MTKIVVPASVRRIVSEVAEASGFSADDLLGPGRRHKLAQARWIAFERIRREIRIMGCPPSLPQIGGWFGRDHTTVLHGLAKCREGLAPAPTVRLQLMADMAERAGL